MIVHKLRQPNLPSSISPFKFTHSPCVETTVTPGKFSYFSNPLSHSRCWRAMWTIHWMATALLFWQYCLIRLICELESNTVVMFVGKWIYCKLLEYRNLKLCDEFSCEPLILNIHADMSPCVWDVSDCVIERVWWFVTAAVSSKPSRNISEHCNPLRYICWRLNVPTKIAECISALYTCNDLFQSIMQIKDDKVSFTATAKVI